MKKYTNLKHVIMIFLLINALFTPSITIDQVSGDINDPPIDSDLVNQTIVEANTNIDTYMYNDNSTDDVITQTYPDNTELNGSIDDRVESNTTSNGNEERPIDFTAENTGNSTDSNNTTFNSSSVNDTLIITEILDSDWNGGGTINSTDENTGNSTDSNNSTSNTTTVKNLKKNDINSRINSKASSPIGSGGAIWTTRDDCGTQEQNANWYCSGDVVYINGANFQPNKELNWDITGLPGSCDPNTAVANGTHNSGDDGSFCFSAYTIKTGDCGEYKANVENKSDNFKVKICNNPPIGNDDYATVTEGGTVTLLDSGNDSVLDNDTDADGDPLTAVLVSGPNNGSLTLNSDGTFSYIHDSGETISDSFVYNVSDPSGAYDHATVFISINSQNDDPVAEDDYATVDEDSTDNQIDVLDNDYDEDGDGLIITNVGTATNGQTSYNTEYAYYTPNENYCGYDQFTYTITDDNGSNPITATVYITVSCSNDPPIANNDSYLVNEGDTLNVVTPGVLNNDVDFDGDPLTVILISGPSHSEIFMLNGDGSFNYAHDGSETIIDSFIYNASDPSGAYSYATVTITIDSQNDPPNTPSDPHPYNSESNVDLSPVLSVNVSDPDGDVLNVSFYDASDDSLIDVDVGVLSGGIASVVWSDLKYTKVYSWYAVANDSQLENKSNTLNFITKAPVGGAASPPDADANGPYYESLINGTAEVEFDGSGSTGFITLYSWEFGDGEIGEGVFPIHNYTAPGKFYVNLTVSGPGGSDTDQTFVVISEKPNNPPETPTIIGPITGHKNTTYEYTALSFDADNDTITYYFNWNDTTNPTIIYDLPNGTTTTVIHSWDTYGFYTVTVKASDNKSESGSTILTVLIDVVWIEDIGYLIDENSNGTYDSFYSNETNEQISVEKEDDWIYLIDSDRDGKRDYAYNQTTRILTLYYNFIYDKFLKIYQEETPGFEVISVLIMMALVIIILRRRKR